MAIEIFQAFKTSDGKIFDEPSKAIEHERFLKVEKLTSNWQLYHLADEPMKLSEAIAQHCITYHGHIGAILNNEYLPKGYNDHGEI